MSYAELERMAIEEARTRYISEGYHIIEDTKSNLLPRELGTYRPDLIIERDGKFVAIEFKQREIASVAKRFEKIEQVFNKYPEWQFQIFYIDQLNLPQGPTIQSVESIHSILSDARSLVENSLERVAFLACWTAFEAAARRLEPEEFTKPQPASRLITILAEKGHISLSTADYLRGLVDMRNLLAHGMLDVRVTEEQCLRLIDIIDSLLQEEEQTV